MVNMLSAEKSRLLITEKLETAADGCALPGRVYASELVCKKKVVNDVVLFSYTCKIWHRNQTVYYKVTVLVANREPAVSNQTGDSDDFCLSLVMIYNVVI